MPQHRSPLTGLKVIDCSGMIAGGFATMQLADFGADVVTIEHPEHGDPLREWPPFDGDISLWWKAIGRNKRCITLDLSSEEGQELLLKLVEDADLLFENFRPGTMERWNLGPENLHTVNPELIFVRISGYGQTGPLAKKPGFGTIAEGLSGWAHANGYPDREPLLPPISLADLTAAQFAVQAAMFAIFDRDLGQSVSDEGEVIDVSLYEPLFRLFIPDVAAHDQLGRIRERTGNQHPNAAPRNIYETADGYITLSASSQAIFERVMDAIDRPDLIGDTRFETNQKRIENAKELNAIIEMWTCERSTEEVLTRMDEADAIVGPVYDIEDIFEDEHFQAREDIIEIDDDELGSIATMNTVPRFSRTSGSVQHLGPNQGEYNAEVFLGDLNLDQEYYEQLRSENII